jgi:hypothetical protein
MSVTIKSTESRSTYSENNCPQGLYLLGYNAVKSFESQPTFRRNVLPPASGSKNKSSKLCLHFFHSDFILDLFFDHEDGSDMFFINIDRLSADYAALYPTTVRTSAPSLEYNFPFLSVPPLPPLSSCTFS